MALRRRKPGFRIEAPLEIVVVRAALSPARRGRADAASISMPPVMRQATGWVAAPPRIFSTGLKGGLKFSASRDRESGSGYNLRGGQAPSRTRLIDLQIEHSRRRQCRGE